MPKVDDTLLFWGDFWTVLEVNEPQNEVRIAKINGIGYYNPPGTWHTFDPAIMKVQC